MKKRFNYILFLLIGITVSVNSIAQITFQKTYGGIKNDGAIMQQTLDGGYVIAGSTKSFGVDTNYYDTYLIKVDENGNLIWTKTFGGVITDYGSAVAQTNDRGFILSGVYRNGIPGNDDDIYLIKTDSIGDTLWTKTIGGPYDQEGSSILVANDGGYVIAGSNCCGTGGSGIYLVKTNSYGTILWTKTFGGTIGEDGKSIKQTSDNGFIICGSTQSFGAGQEDVYLVKTDSMGNLLWSKTFGGPADDNGYSVQQTIDGGYIIGGNTHFGVYPFDAYFIKTDSLGSLLWSKTYGNTGNEVIDFVMQTIDGGFIMTGSSTYSSFGSFDVIVIKTDSNGNLTWVKNYGGTGGDGGSSIFQTADGGYIICGGTQSFGAGGSDIYLIKTDSIGNSGCNQNAPVFITTTPATQVSNPATIVGSGGTSTVPFTGVGSGGITTTLCTTLGNNEVTHKSYDVNIFPNPANNYLAISLPSMSKIIKVTITDITGKIIYKTTTSETQKIEVNTKDFAEGIYVVQIQTGEFLKTEKLIVTK